MSQSTPPPDFHILALSGGGYRGLYTATVLKTLEQSFGEPISRKFDLICGTSVGGILALGIAAGIPTGKLQNLFVEQGEQIFGRRGFLRRLATKLTLAKHPADGLRKVVESKFGNMTIGDLNQRILIPAVNYSTGRPQIFKTPHAAALESDLTLRLVDVALATSAAPTYFPLHRINDLGVFADGGLVGNSPGFFGLHEAKKILGLPPETNIRVLAIGTMTVGATARGKTPLDKGILRWGTKIFDLVISAQEGMTDAMLSHHLADGYFRIDDTATPDQSKDISLDNYSEAATNVLKDRGAAAGRAAIGDPKMAIFRSHTPIAPIFYHGPHKNC
ncbi:patatin [Novimethylophilus kurashikiensis]|uniref:Patatin n=1 Tax=Novimethylophilus kurashikiensis TaxID=1825523 RepID=A0A2R5FB63_9PROT|nr:CBASS cGAMP-activated phospholipase [Novimethylophilus kurashikiensis]GBG14788.1 patatin [Novimethylophilus kurashikiensis]